MNVVATAGHVDHGKSTLVRALTGMEPDRFAEERRRGMTIDLGYAWTSIAGRTLAFVDVPGHERFIGTMLAGLGPAPAVVFVVAADEGWRRQSSEHLSAVDALGLRHGLLVISRADLADPAGATIEAQERIAGSSLGDVPAVAVSAVTGAGLADLRDALVELAGSLPTPVTDGRVRLWVDRSFTIRGAGTVVTGTLGRGTLAVGDTLQLGARTVQIRGLHTLGEAQTRVSAVARVAINLRGVEVVDVGRGDALLTPGAWPSSAVLDVRLLGSAGEPVADLPGELVAHLGTAALPVRVRRLPGSAVFARLTLSHALPVEPGDRIVFRDPGRHAVAAGAVVLDADPPGFGRRGAAGRRALALDRLATADAATLVAERVARHGLVRRADLAILGLPTADVSRVTVVGEWLVDPTRWRDVQEELRAAVDARALAAPLDPRIPDEAARHLLALPDRALVIAAAAAAGLEHRDGRISRPVPSTDLGAAEAGIARLEEHLRVHPFAAPERPELDVWGLTVRELAAAERLQRVVRLLPDVVLLPSGPAQAMRILAGLPQPFTTSEARQALGTTRRVVIPLLEHLDRRGWTQRLDSGHRRVRGST